MYLCYVRSADQHASAIDTAVNCVTASHLHTNSESINNSPAVELAAEVPDPTFTEPNKADIDRLEQVFVEQQFAVQGIRELVKEFASVFPADCQPACLLTGV